MTTTLLRQLSGPTILAAALLIMLLVVVEGTQVQLKPQGVQGVIVGKDDPGGRLRYEWLRLRDPATGKIPDNIRREEMAFASTVPTRESLQLGKPGTGSSIQAITWSKRGPDNLGGRTRALGIDIADANIVIAAGVSGGVWRSTNGGTTWNKRTAASELHSVTCIAQDTRSGHRNVWYYGTGEYLGNSATGGGGSFYSGNGIYKSTDNGLAWSVLTSTVPGGSSPVVFDQMFDYVWNVATDASSSQEEVYAATVMGINRSTNGGTSWTVVRGGYSNSNSRFTDVAVTSTGVVYAALSDINVSGGTGALSKGIYRSTDGVAWTNITSGSFPSSYGRIVMGIAPSNENVVYFLVQGANGTNGVNQINGHQFWKYTYVTGDGSGTGGTWVNRGVNLPNESGLSGNAVFDTQGGYDMLVRVKPDNENFVIVGSTNLYRSTDGFATTTNWTRIGGYAGPATYVWYTNHHPDIHGGAFPPGSSSTFLSSHDEGVAKTTNIAASTVAWTSLNNGYHTTQFYTVTLDHATSGNPIIIGGMQDNGTWFVNSTVSTTPWVQLFSGDGAACAIANGRTSYYVSSQNGVIYRMLLDGNGNPSPGAWFTRVDPTGGTGYLFINPFVLDPSDSKVMYLAAGTALWRNSDLTGIAMLSNSTTSTNWTNMTGSAVSGGSVSAFGVSTASPASRLYFGSSNGKLYRLDNAKTAGASTVPTDVWTGKGFPSGAYVSCIAVDPNDGNRAMVVFSNYNAASLFYTTNAGSNWTNVEGNLAGATAPSCRWASIVTVGSVTTYFVGTSTGLYSTFTLNGVSTVWAQEGSSTIGNVVIDMIDARTSDGLVVVGAHGHGVFSGTAASTGVAEELVPLRTALMQNYPNPFNPTTVVSYQLSVASMVKLVVYDLEGREVAVLVDERKPAGSHEVTFDGTRLSTGVYVCQLTAGQSVETRKMLLIK